jgi:Ca-activated chloride channel family protein
VRQIYGNHSPSIQEGTYTFALPSAASVSDFAVWDDVVRIPGVILERRRAEEIYSRVRAMEIDPGLLRMGERTAEEAARNNVFTAKIVPFASFPRSASNSNTRSDCRLRTSNPYWRFRCGRMRIRNRRPGI